MTRRDVFPRAAFSAPAIALGLNALAFIPGCGGHEAAPSSSDAAVDSTANRPVAQNQPLFDRERAERQVAPCAAGFVALTGLRDDYLASLGGKAPSPTLRPRIGDVTPALVETFAKERAEREQPSATEPNAGAKTARVPSPAPKLPNNSAKAPARQSDSHIVHVVQISPLLTPCTLLASTRSETYFSEPERIALRHATESGHAIATKLESIDTYYATKMNEHDKDGAVPRQLHDGLLQAFRSLDQDALNVRALADRIAQDEEAKRPGNTAGGVAQRSAADRVQALALRVQPSDGAPVAAGERQVVVCDVVKMQREMGR